MAKKGGKGLSSVLLGLPWIFRLLIAIFFDFVYGIARFIDGLIQGKLLKIIIGFLWIFYGLAIGWILDIIFVALNKRPILM